MKKRISPLLCLFLCIGMAYSTSAEPPLSAKQILLGKLKSLDLNMESQPFYELYGSSGIKINKLSGSLVSGLPFPLAGTALNLNYKFDIPEKRWDWITYSP